MYICRARNNRQDFLEQTLDMQFKMEIFFIFLFLVFGTRFYGMYAKFIFINNETFGGLIFEKVAEVSVSYNAAKLNYRIDLDPYLNELEKFEMGIMSMKYTCDGLTNLFNSTCGEITTIFDSYSKEMVKEKDSLIYFNKTNIRTRRNALIVSLLAVTGLGMINDKMTEFSESYELMLEIINKTIEHQNNFTKIIEDKLNTNREKITELKLEHQLNSIANIMTLLKINFEKIMRNLLSVLNNNSIHSILQIIPISQFVSDLKNMRNGFHADEMPPEIIPQNIINMADATSYIQGNFLIIKISIPIILNTKLNLFKSSFVPIRINGVWWTMKSQTKYFISNENFTQIYKISDYEKQCRETHEANFICRPGDPIITNPRNSCELSLMRDLPISTLLNVCKFTWIEQRELIIQLLNKNEYFIISSGETKVIETCNKTQTFKIQGSGRLLADPNCTYHFGTTKIYGKRDYILKNGIAVEIKTDFNQLSGKILENLELPYITKVPEIKIESLELTEEIKIANEKMKSPLNNGSFSQYFTLAQYTTKIALVIAILVSIYKVYKFITGCFSINK